MQLYAWAHSMSIDGARSISNCEFLVRVLGDRVSVAMTGTTISASQTVEKGVACIRLLFHLPLACQTNAVSAIPVLVPDAWAGSGSVEPTDIFDALIEEIIILLGGFGPRHSLIRLYQNNDGRRPHQHSSGRQQPHDGFLLFFNILRQSHHSFPSLGEVSGAFGVLEVAQARTPSHEVSGDFIVTVTLSNREQMSLFLQRSIARLPMDWMLDWLEVQHRFSSRVW